MITAHVFTPDAFGGNREELAAGVTVPMLAFPGFRLPAPESARAVLRRSRRVGAAYLPRTSRPTWREWRAPALWRRGEVQFDRLAAGA